MRSIDTVDNTPNLVLEEGLDLLPSVGHRVENDEEQEVERLHVAHVLKLLHGAEQRVRQRTVVVHHRSGTGFNKIAD